MTLSNGQNDPMSLGQNDPTNTNDYTMITNNAIAHSSNERENFSPDKQKQLELAERIYNEYPKKKGKANAIKSILALIRGEKTFNGKKVKLSNEQFANAICDYEDYIEKNKIEEKYIAYASTFFNSTIFDYLEL